MKLNLGCGIHTMKDWSNIDIDFGGSMNDHHKLRHDLSRGLPKHIASESVDIIFSEHFIEHIHRSEALVLLRDCFHVLKVGGMLRLVTPSLERLVRSYKDNKVVKMSGVWEPTNRCDMMNEGMRSWGHKWIYDREDMIKLLAEAGFKKTNVVFTHKHTSTHPLLKDLEVRPEYFEMYVEVPKTKSYSTI